jgi:hypothetical protein
VARRDAHLIPMRQGELLRLRAEVRKVQRTLEDEITEPVGPQAR